MLPEAVVQTFPNKTVAFPVNGSPPVYTAIIRNSTLLTNTTDNATVMFDEEGNYTCVATSKYGSDLREFSVVFYGELKFFFGKNSQCRC